MANASSRRFMWGFYGGGSRNASLPAKLWLSMTFSPIAHGVWICAGKMKSQAAPHLMAMVGLSARQAEVLYDVGRLYILLSVSPLLLTTCS